MPVKLRAPERQAPSLVELLRLSPTDLAALLQGLREERPSLALADLTESIEARLSMDRKHIDGIVGLLTDLGLGKEGRGLPVKEFVAELRAAMETSGREELQPPDWTAFQDAIEVALSDDSAQSARLDSFRSLQRGWDSYYAEPPSATAIANARHILHVLWSSEVAPPVRQISPSVEGGVAVVFTGRDKKYADIECFNNGDILAITSDGTTEPSVWSLNETGGSIRYAVEKLNAFFNG